MSFGFSVGDFIAVASLARDLYKDIYKVARHAPEEVQILGKEIAIFSQSIDLLIKEIEDPDSILVRAGDDRVAMTNSIVEQTGETLHSLDKILSKYELRGKSAHLRGKLRFAWDRFKFALDFASINELRGKLQYHNGVINLLLTSVNGSSLQRVEQSNAQMQSDIDSIRQLLAAQSLGDLAKVPLLSSLDDSPAFKMSLSAAFLKNAETFQPWVSTSFEEWVQVGKWWLLKAQKQLSAMDTSAQKIQTQAYADLLKSAWILIDILPKHPQAKFWSASESYRSIVSLGELVKSELQVVSTRHLKVPALAEVETADLTIWSEEPLSLDLRLGNPAARREGDNFWRIGSNFVLGSTFGAYMASDQSPRVACLLLILVDLRCQYVQVTARTQKEDDILSFHIQPDTFKSRQTIPDIPEIPGRPELQSFLNHPFRLFDYGPESGPMNGFYYIPLSFGGRLLFDDMSDQFLFECIIESAMFYLLSLSSTKRHVKELLGILLIRINEMSPVVGIKAAKSAAEQLIALGSHTADHDDGAFYGLWPAGLRVAEELTRGPAQSSSTPSPALPHPAPSQPPIRGLCSPVLVFSNRLLEAIASKATQHDVKNVLDAICDFETLRPSGKPDDAGDTSDAVLNLFFYAVLSQNLQIVSSLLQLASNLDANARFTAFGEYQRVTIWAGMTSAKAYRLVLADGDFPRYAHQYPSNELTALDFAVLSGQLDMLEVLLAHPGTDVDAHPEDIGKALWWQTPLSYAAYVGNRSAVALLLNAGADLDGDPSFNRGNNKHTPLQHAVISHEVEIMETLIRSGAKVNVPGRYYKTALHLARDDVIAKMLLDAGADPSAGDDAGRTPYWDRSKLEIEN